MVVRVLWTGESDELERAFCFVTENLDQDIFSLLIKGSQTRSKAACDFIIISNAKVAENFFIYGCR